MSHPTLFRDGGLYCIIGDAHSREGTIYGLTPDELYAQFENAGGWEVAFAYQKLFERRRSRNPVYVIGVQRL